MNRLVALLALAAAAAGAAPAAAQGRPTGMLRVVVKDPSGAVIPNAVVVVKGIEPSTEDLLVPAVTSDGQGVATAPNLPAGRYAISVTFPGFESRTLADVRVRPGENRREVTLPIEKVAESVAVGRDPATAAARIGAVLHG